MQLFEAIWRSQMPAIGRVKNQDSRPQANSLANALANALAVPDSVPTAGSVTTSEKPAITGLTVNKELPEVTELLETTEEAVKNIATLEPKQNSLLSNSMLEPSETLEAVDRSPETNKTSTEITLTKTLTNGTANRNSTDTPNEAQAAMAHSLNKLLSGVSEYLLSVVQHEADPTEVASQTQPETNSLNNQPDTDSLNKFQDPAILRTHPESPPTAEAKTLEDLLEDALPSAVPDSPTPLSKSNMKTVLGMRSRSETHLASKKEAPLPIPAEPVAAAKINMKSLSNLHPANFDPQQLRSQGSAETESGGVKASLNTDTYRGVTEGSDWVDWGTKLSHTPSHALSHALDSLRPSHRSSRHRHKVESPEKAEPQSLLGRMKQKLQRWNAQQPFFSHFVHHEVELSLEELRPSTPAAVVLAICIMLL